MVITDKPVDRKDRQLGGGFLERTLTLRGPEDRTLYFRAAVHAELEDAEGGAVTIGRRATIRASGRSGAAAAMQPLVFQIRPSARDLELIVPVEIRQGKSILVLEYRWLEEGSR